MLKLTKNQNSFIIPTLLITTFLAHFIFIRGFGLYEDDYAFIHLNWTFDKFISQIQHALTAWPSGRPVGNIIPFTIGYLSSFFDSLIPAYIFAYFVIATNSILMFFILRRFSPPLIALVGALTYIAFPADTTKILLIHNLGIQTGLTFTLLASLLYLKGWRITPYILATLSLLTYETTWLPLLFIPLLKGRLNQKLFTSWFIHLAIMAAIFITIVGIRSFLGETRIGIASDGDKVVFLLKTASILVIGPATSAFTFLLRPFTAIIEGDLATYITIIFTAILLAYVFRKLIEKNTNNTHNETIKIPPLSTTITCDKNILASFKLIIVSILMWMSTYTFSFTHWPGFSIAGRMTSVHIAASIPAAIFMAGLLWLLINTNLTARKKHIIGGSVALYIALLVGWNVVIQNDYVKSWNQQKSYWSQIVALCPDIEAGTQIFLAVKEALPDTKYIRTHSWADYMMLQKIYHIPIKSKLRPKVTIISTYNANTFYRKDGKLFRSSRRPKPGGGHHMVEEELNEKKIIILTYDKGKINRIKKAITINNLRIPLSPVGEKTSFKRTLLYDLIMEKNERTH